MWLGSVASHLALQLAASWTCDNFCCCLAPLLLMFLLLLGVFKLCPYQLIPHRISLLLLLLVATAAG